MERMIRTFIAVDIPDSTRVNIGKLQDKLRQHRADVKWVRPEGIHITLKFLGNVEEGRIEEVVHAVREAVNSLDPFVVALGGTGTFPNARRPRVLWVGVEKGSENLVELATRIEAKLSDLGFPKEKRKFSAHLTIGRVRSPSRIEATVRAMHSIGFEGEGFEVGEVVVMKSDLRPTGAIYTALGRIKLRG